MPTTKPGSNHRSGGEISKEQRQAKIEAGLKTGLQGRNFIFRNEEDRTTKYQGLVHCIIPSAQGDLVLVQYYEGLMGEPNTMALIPLVDMVEKPGANGGYVFFEDDDHLRFYMEHRQGPHDQRVWNKKWAEEDAARGEAA